MKEGKQLELQISNVFKSFGEKEVLKDVSFNAKSGEALGLLGRNGAGKTTTIKAIMGILDFDGFGISAGMSNVNRHFDTGSSNIVIRKLEE